MIDLNTPEMTFALHAVRQASLLIRQVHVDMGSSILSKEDLSPVTVADFASQAFIGHLLSETFPNDPMVAEENSSILNADTFLEQVTEFVGLRVSEATPDNVRSWIDRGNAEPTGRRFWVLDPLDGTKGFLRDDQYVVALALFEEGQLQLSVLGCPNLSDAYRPDVGGPGTLVVAERGQGTWATTLAGWDAFERLHVSERRLPEQARLLRSYEPTNLDPLVFDSLRETLHIQPEMQGMDSQAKFVVLAAGKGDVFIRTLPAGQPAYREKIWDVAPGVLIAQEAGGWVSDMPGRALNFSTGRTLQENRGLLAANGHLHPAFVEALAHLPFCGSSTA